MSYWHIVSCSIVVFAPPVQLFLFFFSLDCEAMASKVLWKPATLGDCSAHRAQLLKESLNQTSIEHNVGLTFIVFLHSDRIVIPFKECWMPLFCIQVRNDCGRHASTDFLAMSLHSQRKVIIASMHLKCLLAIASFFGRCSRMECLMSNLCFSVYNGRSEGVSDTQNQFSCCTCMFD